MSVDLQKNRESILKAWKDVLNDKTATNWALFSYEGQSNVLKVVETGEDGISELAAELNSCKIMYAFLRVDNHETGIVKYAFINFQGEGAPTIRKGTCSKHVRDICNLLQGAHITIAATTEDDVEESRIMEKFKILSNDYKIKSNPQIVNDRQEVVGTNYSRIIPTREINPVERDEFWRKEEEEEKTRLQTEYDRQLAENSKFEEERRKREEKEFEKREKGVIAKENTPQLTNRTNEIKLQREKEIKEVIGNRVNTTKAIFMNNTSTTPTSTPTSPINTKSITFEQTQEQTPQVVTSEENLTPSSNEEKNIINELRAEVELEQQQQQQQLQLQQEQEQQQNQEPQYYQEEANGTNVYEDVNPDGNVATDLNEEPILRARALYDYQAADDTEISFDPGDIITHIDKIDEGWWQGLGPDNVYGLFPANYVALI
uniref:Putative cell migration n=1 Tax=Corethrella appendiculata TaxID=1370023 RepID=U5EUU1_9DIPT